VGVVFVVFVAVEDRPLSKDQSNTPFMMSRSNTTIRAMMMPV
jgi:hypothetical protein